MSTIPFAGMKEAFRRVENIGRIENLHGDALLRYEHDLKAYRDYQAQLLYAETVSRAEGIEIGIVKGRAEGRAEGIAEGRAEGRAELLAQIIQPMLNSGLSVLQISKMINVSEDEIRKIIQ